MFLDQRRGWLEQARYYLSAAAYPLQLAVSSPTAAWRWFEQSVETRQALRAENETLRERERVLEMRSERFEALSRENGELRGLQAALPPVADHWLVAETVNVELSSLQQRVLINRGARNGVFKGQAVMDSQGLLGQTTHVGPWSAEVILITDPEHALPVQIERTGVRTIAVGTGDTQSLSLRYLPANADVRPGDLLVTSGLGGVFPQGYPVARVVEVRPDAVQPLAQIRAKPLAQLDELREVMLVWFRPDHPAAPTQSRGESTVENDLASGNSTYQPQRVPQRPATTAPARTAHVPSAPAAAKDTAAPPGANSAAGSSSGSGSSGPPAPGPAPAATPPGSAPASAPPGSAPAATPPSSAPTATSSSSAPASTPPSARGPA
jgi:rod shape-determining protein MreC